MLKRLPALIGVDLSDEKSHLLIPLEVQFNFLDGKVLRGSVEEAEGKTILDLLRTLEHNVNPRIIYTFFVGTNYVSDSTPLTDLAVSEGPLEVTVVKREWTKLTGKEIVDKGHSHVPASVFFLGRIIPQNFMEHVLYCPVENKVSGETLLYYKAYEKTKFFEFYEACSNELGRSGDLVKFLGLAELFGETISYDGCFSNRKVDWLLKRYVKEFLTVYVGDHSLEFSCLGSRADSPTYEGQALMYQLKHPKFAIFEISKSGKVQIESFTDEKSFMKRKSQLENFTEFRNRVLILEEE